MNGVDQEEDAVFEQMTLSDFKMWNSIALKTFSGDSIRMTNISDNITASWGWGCCLYC